MIVATARTQSPPPPGRSGSEVEPALPNWQACGIDHREPLVLHVELTPRLAGALGVAPGVLRLELADAGDLEPGRLLLLIGRAAHGGEHDPTS
jgi:hypothetical protein